MARMVHAGQFIGVVVVIMLILALVLSLMTSMAGSSRTLYQASLDGWLPKYLAKVNAHGAPTNAMLTNLGFNLLLLADVGYGVRHRRGEYRLSDLQFPEFERRLDPSAGPPAAGTAVARAELDPRAPAPCCRSSIWPSWDSAPTCTAPERSRPGSIFAALIVPVFVYRHYIQDKGSIPAADGRRIWRYGRRRAAHQARGHLALRGARARHRRGGGDASRWRSTEPCWSPASRASPSMRRCAPDHARPLSPDAGHGARRGRPAARAARDAAAAARATRRAPACSSMPAPAAGDASAAERAARDRAVCRCRRCGCSPTIAALLGEFRIAPRTNPSWARGSTWRGRKASSASP